MNALRSTLYALILLAAMANPFQLHSQIEIRDVNKPFFLIFDSIASGLDTTVIPGGILYNRILPWSNLLEWRDEDTITTHRFYQAWWDLEMSNVHNFTADSYSEVRDTLSLRTLWGQLTVPVIRYNFAYFDSLSFANGYFDIVDGIIYDTHASSEPYHEAEVGIASFFHGDIFGTFKHATVIESHNWKKGTYFIEMENLSESTSSVLRFSIQ